MKLINIVGARPQFIKLTAICRAIDKFNRHKNKRSKIHQVILHTGQHYDYAMDDIFFEELHIPKAYYNLEVGSDSHGRQTALMLEKIEKVLNREKPDVGVVYGDTNSTLAGALAAAKLNIPVAHVEAGLRSFNKNMPEEINRVLTDHISKFLFCPTQTAVENLTNEGIKKGVFKVGDVMFDALLFYSGIAQERSQILKTLQLEPKSYSLSTIHRQENTDNPKCLKSILESLNDFANNGDTIILPLHPRTKKAISLLKFKIDSPRFKMIPPVSYLDMLVLEKNAKVILTDSGGVQKEASFFRVPCITLREETEWLETIQKGSNILVATDPNKIKNAFRLFREKKIASNIDFGDGNASKKIIELLSSLLS